MTINAAITNLVSKVSALPGMKQAPSVPIESAGGCFPFAIVYEYSGSLDTLSAGFANDKATIYVEIHVERALLPEAITKAMTFRDPFLKALISDPNLSGTVSVVNAVRRLFGGMEYGNTKTIGYRFEIDVKIKMEV
jgi:hypothetical protein